MLAAATLPLKGRLVLVVDIWFRPYKIRANVAKGRAAVDLAGMQYIQVYTFWLEHIFSRCFGLKLGPKACAKAGMAKPASVVAAYLTVGYNPSWKSRFEKIERGCEWFGLLFGAG